MEKVNTEQYAILDACCGSRMFYFNKENSNVLFQDNRVIDTNLCDGRRLIIKPDIIADFTNMPYKDSSFSMVIFDPPHLLHAGKDSWLNLKYGTLPLLDWEIYLEEGFKECFRVLKPYGCLIFKFSNNQIPFNKVVRLARPEQPLIGDRRGKTRWIIFCKGACLKKI